MNVHDRMKSLSEVESILKSFVISEKLNIGLSASYFSPHCFAKDDQGIHCIYTGNDLNVVENLLGLLDIPTMMNGLQLESVKSQATGAIHVFVYDDDKFHVENLKRLNIMNTEEISLK